MIPGDGPYRPRQNENSLLEWLSQEAEFNLALRLLRQDGRGDIWMSEGPVLGKYPGGRPEGDGATTMLVVSAEGARRLALQTFGRGNPSQHLPNNLVGPIANRIYRFRAERFNLGRRGFGSNNVLAPDASNLPEAINTLNANPPKFQLLNELVREILPQVRLISVRPIGNEVQIIVWPHDPTTRRDDHTSRRVWFRHRSSACDSVRGHDVGPSPGNLDR
jgi:hypothetical protein